MLAAIPHLDSDHTLQAYKFTNYTTFKAPCTRKSTILDTRPMGARFWRTADAIVTLWRSRSTISLARKAKGPMSICSLIGHSDGYSAVGLPLIANL